MVHTKHFFLILLSPIANFAIDSSDCPGPLSGKKCFNIFLQQLELTSAKKFSASKQRFLIFEKCQK